VKDLLSKRIVVTGGSGMLGRALQKQIPNAIYVSSKDADLRDKTQTENLFRWHKPEVVIHLAGRVGGIKANMDNLGDFFYENIMINSNVLQCCKQYEVQKTLSVLSTCVYPNDATYPLTENQIHSGRPHHSNYGYAYAKRMLDVQSRSYRQQFGCNFITIIPNNLFGIHDNFDLEDSHVIPAMIRKFYEAKRDNKSVVLWGDGTPLREFTYADDMARIILFLLKKYNSSQPINVGNTEEHSISTVANMISDIYNFQGNVVWDTSGPPGQFRKPSNNKNLINLGWSQGEYTSFKESLLTVCKWFEENYDVARGVV